MRRHLLATPSVTRRPGGSNRPGFALIMVSILLVILVGVTAIAIDFGRMYLFRTQLHTSSDAAAMGGALRVLAGDATGAADTSVAYGTSHQVDQSWAAMTHADVVPGTWDWQTSTFTPAPGLSWTSSAVNAVQATARYNAPFTFGRIFGYASRARQATSIAAVGSVGATYCVRPFAIPYAVLLEVLYPGAAPPVTYDLTVADVARLRTLTIANEILLKVGDSGQSPVPGNYYAVRLPPVQYANGESGDPWHGANSYRDAIGASCDQLPFVVGVGDWLQAEQGNMVGPTRDGIATLCGVAGGQSFVCNPPAPAKIAIWDVASRSIAPHYSYRVKYVGAFFVTGFSKDGVTGYFQSIASTGSFTPEPGPLSKVALVR